MLHAANPAEICTAHNVSAAKIVFLHQLTAANLYFKRLNGIGHYFANHPNKTDAVAYPSARTPLARRRTLRSLFLTRAWNEVFNGIYI